MKVFIANLWFLIWGLTAFAQIENPVTWSFSAKDVGEGKAEINIKADIQPGWHVYSQFIKEGGPIPTSFSFNPSKDYTLIGKVAESPKAISSFDKNFNMQIAWHEKQVVFKQLVQVNKATTVKGTLEFMVCNDEKCLPPDEVTFDIPVSVKAAKAVAIPSELTAPPILPSKTSLPDTLDADTGNKKSLVSEPSPLLKNDSKPKNKEDGTLLAIFVAGFLGGLLAFFMPCIYPMIPLTVSFFTKRAGSKSIGIQSAFIYGISIIIIYVALGLLITGIFGASALNEAASSATFNLIFFAVLI